MKIGVDYDGTVSEDVTGWLKAMEALEQSGHEPFIVTFRDRNHDWNDDLELISMNYRVFCTGGVAKKWWCEHFGPGKVDVWIDDRPETVLNNSVYTPEHLSEWRATRVK